MPESPVHTVAIVGAGLIGTSFGLALRRAGFAGRILGVSSPGAIREAFQAGAIDEAASLEDAAGRAGAIYLSQTIGRILETLHCIDQWVSPGTLITDAGSTKRAIIRTARAHIRRGLFIGGHPMAGKERSGAAEADASLFEGRTYVLTPDPASDLETPAGRWLVNWVERIGAALVVTDADEHDRIVSFTSHLTQLASTALAGTVAVHLDSPEQLALSGPGLVDATRLAMSPYDVWRDILETNADSIDRALAIYIHQLETLRENLRTRWMREEFERAAELAARLRGGRAAL